MSKKKHTQINHFNGQQPPEEQKEHLFKKPVAILQNISTEAKVIGGIVLISIVLLFGGAWIMTVLDAKEQAKLDKPLMGEEVTISAMDHVNEGSVADDTTPPSGGPMYEQTAGPGIKQTQASAGNLNHSLEHGAVVVFYKEGLSEPDRKKIEEAFIAATGSKIMTPWKGLDVPVTLTSWGRILKLETIDAKIIQQFIETNNGRAPEKGMI